MKSNPVFLGIFEAQAAILRHMTNGSAPSSARRPSLDPNSFLPRATRAGADLHSWTLTVPPPCTAHEAQDSRVPLATLSLLRILCRLRQSHLRSLKTSKVKQR